jgi:hypothetical protein
MIKHEIKEVKSNIFAVIIPNDFDRAMTFCRVQEFYESPNEKFRGKHFKMWDYMKWYSEEYGRGFSYPNDWGGFNIPFEVMDECFRNMKDFETPYDKIMYEIYSQIKTMKGNGKAYVIGAADIKGNTFKHEVCHGLYYTNENYNQLVNEITDTIPLEYKLAFRNNLIRMGYTDSVVDDEIQAYLTFGHSYKSFSKDVPEDLCNEWHIQYKRIFEVLTT